MRAHVVGLVLLALGPGAHGQTPAYAPPRTADGHPDFQGVWTLTVITPLERPKGTVDLVLQPEDVKPFGAKIMKGLPDLIDPDTFFYNISAPVMVRGEARSSMIIEPSDGQLPFTPRALKMLDQLDAQDAKGYVNPEEIDTSMRCLNGLSQAPIRTVPAMIPFQFVQTPDTVLFWVEDIGPPRIVYLAGDPPPDALRTFDGYAAGRWEGDTLVVTTTHMRADLDPARSVIGRPMLVGPKGRIVEWFTRVSDTELDYQFTIEDPDLYSRPWRGEFSLTLDPKEAVYEYACHEGNYSLVNTLKAGRVMAGKKKRK